MTRTEQVELDTLAKAVSVGPQCWYHPAVYSLLQSAADTLAEFGWQEGGTCLMCPRPLRKHTCSCPHHQARKRLQQFGVWPA